jgi:hypothetical protein
MKLLLICILYRAIDNYLDQWNGYGMQGSISGCIYLLQWKFLPTKEVKMRGGKAPYAGNALKVPSPATFYERS